MSKTGRSMHRINMDGLDPRTGVLPINTSVSHEKSTDERDGYMVERS
jgi:hypothetical protein